MQHNWNYCNSTNRRYWVMLPETNYFLTLAAAHYKCDRSAKKQTCMQPLVIKAKETAQGYRIATGFQSFLNEVLHFVTQRWCHNRFLPWLALLQQATVRRALCQPKLLAKLVVQHLQHPHHIRYITEQHTTWDTALHHANQNKFFILHL